MFRIISSAALAIATHGAIAQTVLFQESFESGTNFFTLNTTDVGSTSGGANTWLVNDVYVGGDGLADCIGLELPFTIPSTAGQPGGIDTPNGNYMHTASSEAAADGVLCCSFGAADGFCTDAGNHFAAMSNDISTIGSTGVALEFWWLCQGGTANYGEVYYSLDGGLAWTLITLPVSQYKNQSSWVQQSITLPAFSGAATLRFGFRFVNGVGLIAADPGFGIDDIKVIGGVDTEPPTLATGALVASEFCVGGNFVVPYTAAGSFSAGNTFTAQLSDATGAFGSPLIIGSVVAAASGTINCSLPGGLTPGTGYRVRVVSDLPVLIGEPNAVDLSIAIPPSAGNDASIQVCSGQSPINLFLELGGTPESCGSWTTPDQVAFSGIFDPDTDTQGIYTYTTNCPGACPQDQANVLVSILQSASAGNDVQADLCANAPPSVLSTYVDEGATTGQFFYQGQPFPLPNFAVPGNYALEYVVTGGAGCPNDTADFMFTVIAPPDAGTSLTYTVCINAPPLVMSTLLGNPGSGGTWSGPSGTPFSGTLDPASGLDGLYTYTVTGIAPCADDQAFVALVIDPCTGISELAQQGPSLVWRGQIGTVHSLISGSELIVRSVQVMDAAGRVVQHTVNLTQNGSVAIDLHDAASGVYTMLLGTSKGLGTVRVHHALF
ncbi:MAG TPA: hypothetical protein PLE78_00955 [Flavobacteriales bacterium]|nr:hypothetical protein [Flavobacteriales bacterium]